MLISSVKFGELNTDSEGRCDYKNQKANTVIQLQELNENGKLVDFRPQGLSLEHKQLMTKMKIMKENKPTSVVYTHPVS